MCVAQYVLFPVFLRVLATPAWVARTVLMRLKIWCGTEIYFVLWLLESVRRCGLRNDHG